MLVILIQTRTTILETWKTGWKVAVRAMLHKKIRMATSLPKETAKIKKTTKPTNSKRRFKISNGNAPTNLPRSLRKRFPREQTAKSNMKSSGPSRKESWSRRDKMFYKDL